MALSVKTGHLSVATTAVTGLGFQPKLVLFFGVGISGDPGTDDASGRLYGAFDNSGRMWSGFATYDNGAGGGGYLSTINTDGLSCIVTPRGSLASLASLDSDGFTLSWDEIGASDSAVIGYMALGGTSITGAEVGTFLTNGTPGGGGTPSTKTVTLDDSFQATALLFFGVSGTSGLFVGAAASTSNRWYTAVPVFDHSHDIFIDTGVVEEYAGTNGIGIVGADPPNVRIRLDLGSITSTGFTVTHTNVVGGEDVSQFPVAFVALKGVNLFLNSFVARTTTGTQSVTNAGGQPVALGVFGGLLTAAGTLGTSLGGSFVGITDGTNERAFSTVSPFSARQELSGDGLAVPLDSAGNTTAAGRGKFTAFTSSGFDLNWTTASAIANLFYYFGIAAAGQTAASTGLSDGDVFGQAGARIRGTGAGVVDTDALGVGRSKIVGAGAGIADGDAFGQIVARLRGTGIGLADGDGIGQAAARIATLGVGVVDVDAFGTAMARIATHGVGYLDPDTFGNLVFSGFYLSVGFDDVDAYGQARARILAAAVGQTDGDAFGTLVASLRAAAAGLLDVDAFGVGRSLIRGTGVGVNDLDAFGILAATIVMHIGGVADVDGLGVARSLFRTDGVGTSSGTIAGAHRSTILGAASTLLDPDAFGQLVAHLVAAGAGFIDPDVLGTAQARISTSSTGALDPDAFGSLLSVISGATTGVADPESFGTLVAALTAHGVGLDDPDVAGAGRARITGAAAGVDDVDAFGVARSTVVLAAASLIDGDAFGTGASLIRALAAGVVDTDAFGLATLLILAQSAGHLDGDVAGVARSTIAAAVTGTQDGDAFGQLVAALRLAGVGFDDVDGLGVGRSLIHGIGTGFADPDAFGDMGIGGSLRKAVARFRTHRARLWRQLKVDGVKGNLAPKFFMVAYDVPCELHIKKNEIAQAVAGVELSITYECFFDRWLDVRAGDRVEFPGLVLVLTNLMNQGGRYHEGQCERVPGVVEGGQ